MAMSRQALPALMHSRSPSPFLRAGELRGRSPTSKKLCFDTQEMVFPIQLRQALSSYPPPNGTEDTDTENDDTEEQSQLNTTKTNQDGQALPATETDTKLTRNEVTPTTSLGQALPATQQSHDTNSLKTQGQALPAQQELLAALKTRRKQKRNDLFWLLVLLPFLCTFAALHSYLEVLVRARFNSCYVNFGVTVTLQDWNFILRAGYMAKHVSDSDVNVSSTPSTSPKVLPTRVFFLDVTSLPALSHSRAE